MKKLLPVILCSIILFCTACEKTVNPIDRFDDVNSFTTLEKLKEKFPNGKIIEETENSFIVEDHDSLLQDLAEKYGVTVTTEVSIEKSYYDDNKKEYLAIDTRITSQTITKDDMKPIMDQLTQKYGRFEDNSSDDPNSFRYRIYTEIGTVTFSGYIGESIFIRYNYRPV